MSRLVSWYSSDPLFAWFTLLQIVSYLILGVTVAIGYRLSVNQSTTNQKLEADLVDAKTKLAEAETRQAEAEAALLKLQKRVDWRSFDKIKFREVLTASPKGSAQIAYKKDEEESYAFASEIRGSLIAAKWDVEMLPSKDDPDSAAPFALREGVGFSREFPVSLVVGSNAEFDLRGDMRSPLGALIKAFKAVGHLPGIVGSKPNANLPKGVVRIVVGSRL